MKRMDHIEYPKSLVGKTTAELLFIIEDCQESIKALPSNPNCSFYADEICYAGMELRKRKGKNHKKINWRTV